MHVTQNKGVIKSIQKSRYHFLQGNYNECVAECRKILEIFKLNSPETNELGAARTKFSDKQMRESMSTKERILILRDAIHNTTNLPHHYKIDEEYGRYEARVILHSILALLPGYGPV